MEGASDRCPFAVPTTRRAFVCGAARALVAGAVGGAATPLLTSCGRDTSNGSSGSVPGNVPGNVPDSARHTETVDVSPLTSDGQSLVTAAAGPDGAPILIVRYSASRYVALSMQCTHEGCPVNPPVHGVMTCPCHGSQFDLAGRVERGPAQFPLGHYDATYHSATRSLTILLD
jgi:Rieske Fe-S protein